jgi:hypothetical protein
MSLPPKKNATARLNKTTEAILAMFDMEVS